MRKVFFFSVLAMHALMVLLLSERYRLEKTREEFLEVQQEAEAG